MSSEAATGRIARRFAALRGARRGGLIPFVTAGDPSPAATVPMMRAMVASGADLIELGMPFSDPEAEGPSIQAATERSLAAGTRLVDILAMITEFRRRDRATPVILMGYLNPIEHMGYRRFATAAATAGVDGVILVNLPPEEADELQAELDAVGVSLILLVAPTTTTERMRLIVSRARGFLYYVSLKGVTGAEHLRLDSVREGVARLRAHTELPIAVGFGIKDGAAARAVTTVADAAVVGSALVDCVARHLDAPERAPAAVAALVAEMRQAIDG